MTEAVIVATARTPIGRAFKGSLKDIRPDDLSAQVVAGLLAKLPQLDPALVEDLYWGCAEPSGKHGSNIARVIAVLDWELSTLGDPVADFAYFLMNWVMPPDPRS